MVSIQCNERMCKVRFSEVVKQSLFRCKYIGKRKNYETSVDIKGKKMLEKLSLYNYTN